MVQQTQPAPAPGFGVTTQADQPGGTEDWKAAPGITYNPHCPWHLLFLSPAHKADIPLALLRFMFTEHQAALDPIGTQPCMAGGPWACWKSPIPQAVTGVEPIPLAHFPQAFSFSIGKEVAQSQHRSPPDLYPDPQDPTVHTLPPTTLD